MSHTHRVGTNGITGDRINLEYPSTHSQGRMCVNVGEAIVLGYPVDILASYLVE